MAKKKVVLTLFAVGASVTALANNYSHISAPTLAGSISEGEINVQEQKTETARIVVPSVVKVDAVAVSNPDQPSMLTETSIAADQPSVEQTEAVSVIQPSAEAAVTSNKESKSVAEVAKSDAPTTGTTSVEIGKTFFFTDWVEVPKSNSNEVALLHGSIPRPISAAIANDSLRFPDLAPVAKSRSVATPPISPISDNQHFNISRISSRPDSHVRRVEGNSSLALASIVDTPKLTPTVQTASAAFHREGFLAALDRNGLVERQASSAELASLERFVTTTTIHLAAIRPTGINETMPARGFENELAAAAPFESPKLFSTTANHFAIIRPINFEISSDRDLAENAIDTSSLPMFRQLLPTSSDHVASMRPENAIERSREVGSLSLSPVPETVTSTGDHFAYARFENGIIERTTLTGELARAIAPVVFQSIAATEVPHQIFGRFENASSDSHDGSAITAKLFRPIFASAESNVSLKTDVFGPLSIASRQIAQLPTAPLLVNEVPTSRVKNIVNVASSKPTAESVKSTPILISDHVAFSKAMLAPIPLRSTESTDFVPMPAAKSGGPSASIGNILPLEPATKAAADSKLPVLISNKTEFSADLLKPMKAATSSTAAITIPTSAKTADVSPQQAPGYCDANFVGEPIRFSQTVELRLEDLLSQLHARFGVNFIMGPNVGKFPINVKAGSIPWNVLLRSQLFISGVHARCIDTNTIELIENSLLPNLQDSTGVVTKFVKLKFLQRTGGGTVDLANRSQGGQNGGQGGCGGGGAGGGGGGGGQIAGGGGGGGGQSGQTAASQGSSRFDQLVGEIEKILGLRAMTSGGTGGGGEGSEERRTDRFVTQIPGRNILAIRATEDEHQLISQIIERADRPPFQVVIKGLVYSANQDRLRDIGVNITATGGNANGRTSGGIFGDTLGVGTLFDFSTIIGTFDFNVQATAFQQNGVISVKSRPFATVLDGLCTTLSVGTKLPIVIDSTLGGQGGITILNADNLLAVTPYVVDDENGNPIAVTLDLNLQANVIDSSITARGVPAVNSKNIQTQLLLGPDKTVILGGFSIDQDSKTVSKVPGLGDIPIIGELFKRRIQDQRLSRLYFAISAEVIPYPKSIEPVAVPGATTDPRTITEEMKKRAEAGEPKPVDPNEPYTPKKKKKDN